MSRKPMHMADWIAKLDDFLRLSEREYEQFRVELAKMPARVDEDFEKAVKALPKARASERP